MKQSKWAWLPEWIQYSDWWISNSKHTFRFWAWTSMCCSHRQIAQTRHIRPLSDDSHSDCCMDMRIPLLKFIQQISKFWVKLFRSNLHKTRSLASSGSLWPDPHWWNLHVCNWKLAFWADCVLPARWNHCQRPVWFSVKKPAFSCFEACVSLDRQTPKTICSEDESHGAQTISAWVVASSNH
jgi:hypothetical protein